MKKNLLFYLIFLCIFLAIFNVSASSPIVVNPIFDVDGNGQVSGLTDGKLISSYLFGFSSNNEAFSINRGDGATRNSVEIYSYIKDLYSNCALDVDGNGKSDALTDGILISRFMVNVPGFDFTSGALGDKAKRTSVPSLIDFIQGIKLGDDYCKDDGNILYVKYLDGFKEDHAGMWSQFYPGVAYVNKNPYDYVFSVSLTLDSSKTVKQMTLVHDIYGEAWSTSDDKSLYNKLLYPLVVFRSEKQFNFNYTNFNNPSDILMSKLEPTKHNFKIYGQRETEPFRGGKLIIDFLDGSQLSADVIMPTTSGEKTACTDTDGGLDYYNKGIVKGFPARLEDGSSYSKMEDFCLVAGGSFKYINEYYCDKGAGGDLIYTTTYECPSICNDGACVADKISEEVTCKFKEGSGKCYSAGTFNGQEYSCTADGTEKIINNGVVIYSCSMKVENYNGQKIEWKSSCGGYQYTEVDGKDEEIGFTCSSSSSTTPIDIQSIWFRNAYWRCQNGDKRGLGTESSCKPSEFWQIYAEESCKDLCSEDGKKCGVAEYSVSNYCYPKTSTTSTEPEVLVPTSGATDIQKFSCDDYAKDCKLGYEAACFKWKENCYNAEEAQKTDSKADVLICKDSCPLNDKCYTFGYRKSSSYCSDEGEFIKQLSSGKQCENNFECSTNLCVSSKCVSQGFIDKIVNWFKRLFGGE